MSAQADILRNIIVGGLAGKAPHSEGKSETEILDAVGSTVSDSWSVTSSLIKILRAGIGKNGKGGTVQYAIDRYRSERYTIPRAGFIMTEPLPEAFRQFAKGVRKEDTAFQKLAEDTNALLDFVVGKKSASTLTRRLSTIPPMTSG